MADLFSSSSVARRRQLRRLLDRGAGGARAGPPPPRHVHRRHRRARAPPPRRRSARQCDGRGGRRPRQPHRGHARARQPPDRQRQRPRHAGRRASQVSRQVRARSDPDHAPLGRQVLGQGLCDLRRPARRRGQRGQRAVDRDRGRGRARQEALPPELLARASPTSPLEEVGATPNRRGTTVAFTPDPEIFGADAQFKPRGCTSSPAPRPICSPGSRSAGAATRRSPPTRCPRARVPVPRRPRRPSRRADRRRGAASPTSPSPAARISRNEPGPRRMGGRLAALVATAPRAIIATPSRRPTAAPTKRACAPR